MTDVPMSDGAAFKFWVMGWVTLTGGLLLAAVGVFLMWSAAARRWLF